MMSSLMDDDVFFFVGKWYVFFTGVVHLLSRDGVKCAMRAFLYPYLHIRSRYDVFGAVPARSPRAI